MPPKRAVKILLFPILAPILLTGYLLYLVGDSKTRATRRTVVPVSRLQRTRSDPIEMGLMQELTESQPVPT